MERKDEYNSDVHYSRGLMGAVIFKVDDVEGNYFRPVIWHPDEDKYVSRQVLGLGIVFAHRPLTIEERRRPVYIILKTGQDTDLCYVFARIVVGELFTPY